MFSQYLGTILQSDLSYDGTITVALLFLLLRSTWEHLVHYQNSFDTADLFHFVLYLLQAAGNSKFTNVVIYENLISSYTNSRIRSYYKS
jgi:hypothetical protein